MRTKLIFLIQIKPVKPRTSAAPHRERDKRERDSCREKEAAAAGGGGGAPLYRFPPTKLQMSVGESETRRAAFKQDPRVWSFLKSFGNQASDKTLETVWNICICLEEKKKFRSKVRSSRVAEREAK